MRRTFCAVVLVLLAGSFGHSYFQRETAAPSASALAKEFLASLDAVERLVPGHPQLGGVIAHLRATPLRQLQEDYVETFDHTRRCALYLTYFAYGDTRRRGQALVAFKEAYRAAGVEWDDSTGELPLTFPKGPTATSQEGGR